MAANLRRHTLDEAPRHSDPQQGRLWTTLPLTHRCAGQVRNRIELERQIPVPPSPLPATARRDPEATPIRTANRSSALRRSLGSDRFLEDHLPVLLRAVEDGELGVEPVERQCKSGAGQQHRFGALRLNHGSTGFEEASTLVLSTRRRRGPRHDARHGGGAAGRREFEQRATVVHADPPPARGHEAGVPSAPHPLGSCDQSGRGSSTTSASGRRRSRGRSIRIAKMPCLSPSVSSQLGLCGSSGPM